MLPLNHILFPMNFSNQCLATAPFVEAMAKRFGCSVTLLGLVRPIIYGMGEPGVGCPIDSEDLRVDLQKRLDSALVQEFAGVQVRRVAEVGDAASGITGYAHSHGVDLIMMPTHGYGPFRQLLLGSVTAKVLHDTHCPIWTGAHLDEPPALSHIALKNVICAVDRSANTATLMQWASQLSRDTGASLHLLHAIPGPNAFPEIQFDPGWEQSLRDNAQAEIGQVQQTAGVEASLCIGVGDVALAVRDEARRHNADLIVIGRGAIHSTLGRLRAHAHSIIRHAPCPVISV